MLQSQSGGSAAAAAGVLQRALQPGAADGAVAGALSRMDGLAQLHLSIQATSAAAMQRAAEVRQSRVTFAGCRLACSFCFDAAPLVCLA